VSGDGGGRGKKRKRQGERKEGRYGDREGRKVERKRHYR